MPIKRGHQVNQRRIVRNGVKALLTTANIPTRRYMKFCAVIGNEVTDGFVRDRRYPPILKRR